MLCSAQTSCHCDLLRHLANAAFSASPEGALLPAVYLAIFTTKSGFFYINRDPGPQSVDLSRKFLQIPKKSREIDATVTHGRETLGVRQITLAVLKFQTDEYLAQMSV